MRRCALSLVIVAASVAAGCGTTRSAEPTDTSRMRVPASESSVPAEPSESAKPEESLDIFKLKDACIGAPSKLATVDYDRDKPGIHPVVGFAPVLTGTESDYTYVLHIPDGLTSEWEKGKHNLAKMELVVCVKRTDDAVTKKCAGTERELTLHSVTYQLQLFTAKNGDEVASRTMDMAEEVCPESHDGGHLYPDPLDEVIAFIKPHVKIS